MHPATPTGDAASIPDFLSSIKEEIFRFQNGFQNGNVQTKWIYILQKQTNIQTTKMTTLAYCWSMVINNPDENDYTLVRNPQRDYIRQIIWTTEVGGEESTEHIQAYVRLQKQQRMSFIKKLFPRGHFKAISANEYDLNTQNYAQKNDDTTAGAHVNTINDPIMTSDSLTMKIVDMFIEENCDEDDTFESVEEMLDENKAFVSQRIKMYERELVLKNPKVAKILCSPTYAKVKKEWFTECLLSRFIPKDVDGNDEAPVDAEEHSTAEIPTAGSAADEDAEDSTCGSETDESADSGSEFDDESQTGD